MKKMIKGCLSCVKPKNSSENNATTSNAGGASSPKAEQEPKPEPERKFTSQQVQGGENSEKPTTSNTVESAVNENEAKVLQSWYTRASSSVVNVTVEGDTYIHAGNTFTGVRRFTYQEIQKAVRRYKLLGEGASGKVYHGKLPDMSEVAIKRLHVNRIQRDSEFEAELSTLSRVDHPKIVKLIGYCIHGDQKLLVYEYLPLQSLDLQLSGFDWNTRMSIAADVAEVLEYLHDKITPPVIYCDLKCANILVAVGPEGKGYTIKLADFGLAREGPCYAPQKATEIVGSEGYIDPSTAWTRVLTLGSDIYSFGVVLLEFITGQGGVSSTFANRNVLLSDWATSMFRDKSNFSQMACPSIRDQCSRNGLRKAISTAVSCVQQTAEGRPQAADLVPILHSLSEDRNVPEDISYHRRAWSLPPALLDD